MSTKTKEYQIRREIEVPHNGEIINFIYDIYGPDTYAKVAESITMDNLTRPTMGETASLLHSVFQEDEKEFSEIRDLMKNRWLWVFTGTLYVPNKGAYVQDSPKIKDGMPLMEESELVKKLEDNDPTVRHAPFGFKTRAMTPIQLARNPYVIALAGEEGAEKLAQVADKHKNRPYLCGFDSVDSPATRVSALLSDWDWGDRRLYVSDNLHESSDGCAFGVRKTGEASRAEK